MKLNPLTDLPTLVQFVLLFIPGFVSTRIFDLLVPGQRRDYGNALYEVIGYSMVTYAVSSPIILWWITTRIYRPIWETALLALFVLFVLPATLPPLGLALLKTPWFASRVVSPTPSSFDWAFDPDVNPKAMVLLHLNDGRRIGGTWHGNAYVSTYPVPPDVYLSEVWNINQETGAFIDMVLGTRGIVVWGKDIQMIEFFDYENGRTHAMDDTNPPKKLEELSGQRADRG